MSDDNLYLIEKILDRRRNNNRLEYKIKWEGYPMSQSTWEPLENLVSAIEYVEEYDKKHPFKNDQKSAKKDKFLGKKKAIKKKEIPSLKTINNKTKKNNEYKEEEKAEELKKIEEEKSSINIINKDLKLFSIDDSLKGISKIIKRGDKLWASVDKMEKNGEIEAIWLETAKLKIDNPWILLDFYEARIKFK